MGVIYSGVRSSRLGSGEQGSQTSVQARVSSCAREVADAPAPLALRARQQDRPAAVGPKNVCTSGLLLGMTKPIRLSPASYIRRVCHPSREGLESTDKQLLGGLLQLPAEARRR